MKFKYILILSALIRQILSLSAREVTSFNEGWLFKRGPFSQDPVKVAAQWNADWETVNLPHTWNAKDMQVKADAFYEGVGYYRKTQFFGNELKGSVYFFALKVWAPTQKCMSTVNLSECTGSIQRLCF